MDRIDREIGELARDGHVSAHQTILFNLDPIDTAPSSKGIDHTRPQHGSWTKTIERNRIEQHCRIGWGSRLVAGRFGTARCVPCSACTRNDDESVPVVCECGCRKRCGKSRGKLGPRVAYTLRARVLDSSSSVFESRPRRHGVPTPNDDCAALDGRATTTTSPTLCFPPCITCPRYLYPRQLTHDSFCAKVCAFSAFQSLRQWLWRLVSLCKALDVCAETWCTLLAP